MNYIIITSSDKRKANIRSGRRTYNTLNEARLAAIKVLKKHWDQYGIGWDVTIRKQDSYYAKRGIEAYVVAGWVTSHDVQHENVYFTYRSYNRGYKYNYDVTDSYLDPKTGATVRKRELYSHPFYL